MKSTDQGRRERQEHWVGLDVSKGTFDAALALSEQRYPCTCASQLLDRVEFTHS